MQMSGPWVLCGHTEGYGQGRGCISAHSAFDEQPAQWTDRSPESDLSRVLGLVPASVSLLLAGGMSSIPNRMLLKRGRLLASGRRPCVLIGDAGRKGRPSRSSHVENV